MSYFPYLALLGSGLLAGFLAGLLGIGGGFVSVPILLILLPAMLCLSATALVIAPLGVGLVRNVPIKLLKQIFGAILPAVAVTAVLRNL